MSTEEQLEQAKAKLERIAMNIRTIRGAQFDMVNGRPDLDSLEEIDASLRIIEEVLA